MDEPKLYRIIYISCFIGLLLHFKTAFIESSKPIDSFTIKLLLGSLFPYLIIIIARKKLYGSLIATIFVLLFDLFVHLESFVSPSSSTAALGLLFMPFFNTIVIIPLSFLTGNLLKRNKEKGSSHE